MIKERLMDALKEAAEHYNGGMGANAAVVKAAESFDFNEKQAERLAEMFNTLATLNKEKDAADPTGSCELASKEEIIRQLMGDATKKASASGMDMDLADVYGFYSSDPGKTNPAIEARAKGMDSLVKSASHVEESVPKELNVSQRSLYKIISGQIDMLKSASAAADDVIRNLEIEIERGSVKIAKEIESPLAPADMADMFKAACPHAKAVERVSEYSTKVAESDGGAFSKAAVIDSTRVDHLIKAAEEVELNISMIPEYERKRDFFAKKAEEANREIMEAVGLIPADAPRESLADMFVGVMKSASPREMQDDSDCVDLSMKIASLIRATGVQAEDVERLAEDIEKDAASSPKMMLSVPIPSVEDAHSALSRAPSLDGEKKRLMNVRRAVILADLLSNDSIIRDADPDMVAEAYKTMIRTSPRVSLDKAQVRAFLRSAVNSVAISPSDAKVIADVDKGMALSNIDMAGRLTALDSSIKDSNE